jgi:hypothetical protein
MAGLCLSDADEVSCRVRAREIAPPPPTGLPAFDDFTPRP